MLRKYKKVEKENGESKYNKKESKYNKKERKQLRERESIIKRQKVER